MNNVCLLKESSRGIERISPLDRLLERRMIFFTGEVNAENANNIISQLLALQIESTDAPINLFINSPGGSVSDGLAIYDTIRNMKCEVNTICLGTAASMAAIIYLAGENRSIYTNSQIMIHDPLISGLSGSRKALELEKEAQKLMETRKTLATIIAKRCGKTLKEVYAKTKDDCFLNADEALAFGIATEIIREESNDE